MRQKNESPLSDAIKGMLKEYKLAPQLSENKVKDLWGTLMGKTISTYTKEVVVRKNILYLTIISAPLKQELSYAKEKIITLINEELGEDYIRDVIIR